MINLVLNFIPYHLSLKKVRKILNQTSTYNSVIKNCISFLNNALCNRREQGNCEICYSAAAATDVHLSGTGAKVTTIVSNYTNV